MAADERQQTLSRFVKLPAKTHGTALFVGIKGVGKHRVAQALTECNASFSLQIRTATSLPLPKDADNSRPRIDFVVFFIDLTNKLSFEVVKSSAKYLEVEYFLGHTCFVATNVRDESRHVVDVQDVINFADHHDSPLVCADLQGKQEQYYLAQRLMHYLKTACGFHGDITPSLIDTCKRPMAIDEDLSMIS